MNDHGFDIQTMHGHYSLFIKNKRESYGEMRPLLRLKLVPWDGVKKPLEPYDIYRHGPKYKRQLDF